MKMFWSFRCGAYSRAALIKYFHKKMQCLFEGSAYSRAALSRSNTVSNKIKLKTLKKSEIFQQNQIFFPKNYLFGQTTKGDQ